MKYIKHIDLPKRSHLTRKKFKYDKKATCEVHNKKDIGFKPQCSFWYGTNHEWIKFAGVGFGDYQDKTTKPKYPYIGYIYSVEIKDDNFTNIKNKDKNKILVIDSDTDFKKFTQKYGVKMNYKSIIEPNTKYIILINWSKVAKDYGGIEMPNYFFKYDNNGKRNKKYMYWYTTWDVACGCVWNFSVIDKLKLHK